MYKPNGTYFAETHLKDHLGNVRVAYGSDVDNYSINQVNSYYPFGLGIQKLEANTMTTLPKNEYLYNGKMLQDELDLDWLDYGARMYDAVVGRWHVMDAMNEEHFEYTSYAYVFNNPISFVDLFGLDTTYYDNLPPVEITAKRDSHAETMNNPIVQVIHEGQAEFSENPFGHFVLWGWSYIVPIPYIEKGINFIINRGSNAAVKIIKAIATRGAGKNLIRIFKVGNREIWINSGHGFETVHSTGSFSTTNLTKDQIESAIVNDIEKYVNTISKDAKNVTQRTVTVNGVEVGYKAIQIDGKISVSTYYPNPN